MKNYKGYGTFRVTGGNRWDFFGSEGDHIYLEDVVNDLDAPYNTILEVEIFNGVLLNFTVPERLSSSVADYKTPRKHIMLMDMYRSADQITESSRQSHMRLAKESEVLLRAIGKDVWDVQVRSAAVVDDRQGIWGLMGHPYRQDYIQDQIREQHPDFDANFFVSNKSPLDPPIVGLAYIGSFFCVYGPGARNPHTIVHELLHCFGEPHSRLGTNEYGDPGCRVAAAHAGINVCKAMSQGLILPEHIKTVTSNDAIRLVPIDAPSKTIREGEYQAVIVQTDQANWILSTRYSSEQRKEGAFGNTVEYLNVHTFTPAMSITGGMSNCYSGPTFGETVELGAELPTFTNQPKVSLVRIEEDVREVRVTFDNGQQPTSGPLVSPFDIDGEVVDGVDIRDGLKGLWFDPLYELQGFEMHLPDTPDSPDFIGYWYTHDAQGYFSGNPIKPSDTGRSWYLLQGYFEGDDYSKIEVEIFAPLENRVDVVGRGIFYAKEDEKIGFEFYSDHYGRDYQTLTQIHALAPNELNGLYAVKGDEIRGFTLGNYPTEERENRFVAYWYDWKDTDWGLLDGDIENMLTLKPRSMFKSRDGDLVNDINEQGYSQIETDDDGVPVAIVIDDNRYEVEKVF